jgi:hypothetical protein
MNKSLEVLIHHGWTDAEGAAFFSRLSRAMSFQAMSPEFIVALRGALLRPMIGGSRHVL